MDTKHIPTDQEILDEYYLQKDNRLLGLLLQRYTLLLFGVAMKYLKNETLAADAVQQVFLKVIQELQTTRVTYIKSWLYTIVKNYCLMELRRKNILFTSLTENGFEIEEEPPYPERHIEQEKNLVYLHESMSELNPEQKVCIRLFFMEKLSYRQIVDQTGFDLLQVKSHIQNGKRKLKILVEKKQKHEAGRLG
jgi:RNA polymerase sigma-70 factor (ECF subfamily)